ncbi:hypothetical protein [Mixta theicola]|uniref:hypothetical protein n=1 Tax=Mixta theicola TaxID=1458355 RepID=UPI0010572B9F|nr:hypothetical protein [Mixta theicola]GLR10990.1 hypothetical protein GCM10007905_37100 [Mixta theicola]
MNNYDHRSAGTANNAASALFRSDARLCDKMDDDSEWELAQQQNAPEGSGFGPQVVQSFEFDIHDCSVSEVNR